MKGMDINLLLPGMVFLAFGLLTGLMARKFINVAVVVILIFVGLKILEGLGLSPSWPLFLELRDHLFGIGQSMLKLFVGLLGEAPVLYAGLFLLGGIAGTFWAPR